MTKGPCVKCVGMLALALGLCGCQKNVAEHGAVEITSTAQLNKPAHTRASPPPKVPVSRP